MKRLPNEDAMEEYFRAMLTEPKVVSEVPSASSTLEHTEAATTLGDADALIEQTNAAQEKLRAPLRATGWQRAQPVSRLLDDAERRLAPAALSEQELMSELVSQTESLHQVAAILPATLNIQSLEVDELPQLVAAEPVVEVEIAPPQVVTEVEQEQAAQPPNTVMTWENIEIEDEFQALFFELAGITFAVPLTWLGGIHQLTDDGVTKIFGKPRWFLGMMTNREEQLYVVDSATWVMPEKRDIAVNYKYIILLGDTRWGFACEVLHGTERINKADIKWREQAGKRPWLAGMVKQKMCALLHVEALVAMLDQGINVDGK